MLYINIFVSLSVVVGLLFDYMLSSQLLFSSILSLFINPAKEESGASNSNLGLLDKYKKALEDYNNIQKPEVLPETESLRETYVTKAVAPTSDNLSSGMAPQPLLLKQIILIL